MPIRLWRKMLARRLEALGSLAFVGSGADSAASASGPYRADDSRTTEWRIARALHDPMESTGARQASMFDFFSKVSKSNSYEDDDGDHLSLSLEQCLQVLEKKHLGTVSSNKKFDKVSIYDHLRYVVLRRYFLHCLDGHTKMRSSLRRQQLCLNGATPKHACHDVSASGQQYLPMASCFGCGNLVARCSEPGRGRCDQEQGWSPAPRGRRRSRRACQEIATARRDAAP
jgi:hypothetical protein